MDINFQGLRASTSIDVKPSADDSQSAALLAIKSQARVVNQQELGFVNDDQVKGSSGADERREELGQAVSYLQEFAQSIQRDLTFSLDDDSGRVVIEVRDQASGDVIRQIPSEEALKLVRHLEEARSLLFHETA